MKSAGKLEQTLTSSNGWILEKSHLHATFPLAWYASMTPCKIEGGLASSHLFGDTATHTRQLLPFWNFLCVQKEPSRQHLQQQISFTKDPSGISLMWRASLFRLCIPSTVGHNEWKATLPTIYRCLIDLGWKKIPERGYKVDLAIQQSKKKVMLYSSRLQWTPAEAGTSTLQRPSSLPGP